MAHPAVDTISPRPLPALERRLRWERRFRGRLTATDTTVVVLASLAGALPVPGAGLPLWQPAILAALWCCSLAGLRSRAPELVGSGITEYRRVAHAAGLALGLFAGIGIAFAWDGLRLVLFLVGPAGTAALLFGRWYWRRWLQRKRLAGECVSRTLVVGFREDVRYVVSSLLVGGENGFHVVGATLFDDDHDDDHDDEAGRRAPGGANAPEPAELVVGETRVAVLGDVSTVAATAARLGADRIIVASRPEGRADFVKELSWELEGTASELILSHRITDVVGPRISFRPVDGLPLLQIKIPAYEGGRHLFKRGLDIVVASAALAPIALIAPFIAIAIALDSPGPVLFRQERIGRDGRRFKMLKFRSMRVGAEAELAALRELNEGAGPLFKMREDPRITRVGRVLRKLSLDELPQFWNVLVGDMSVVGPRPPLPEEATSYDGVATRRLYIKPGITGLWQVSGRSDLTWEESVRLDLSYVENWSLLQDLQIMWRTCKVMVQPKGAY